MLTTTANITYIIIIYYKYLIRIEKIIVKSKYNNNYNTLYKNNNNIVSHSGLT